MKLFLLVLSFFCMGNFGMAQECNYKVNENDEFTGKSKKITECIVYNESKRKFAMVEFQNIGGDFGLIFRYYRSPATGYSKVTMYTSSEENGLFFKLEGGEVVKCIAKGYGVTRLETATEMGNNFSMGYSRKNMFVFDPVYTVDKSDIEKMAANKVLKVRVECKGTDLQTNKVSENFEFEVPDDIAELIKTNVSCIITK